MADKIRNIAVIAHVDHGKTTLVDAILKQTKVFRDNQEEMQQERILDRNELERERGITILAKNCAVYYLDTKINIIDTPGHVDFSGEVERTLSMADGALLIVDAAEGPMPQTRSVLKKALGLGLKVIVVINKIDKKLANVEKAVNGVESLFLELATNEAQLNFPILYASGREGAVVEEYVSGNPVGDVRPLLEIIIEEVPESVGEKQAPAKLLVTSMEYDPHVGRILVGKLGSGRIAKGMKLWELTEQKSFLVEHLYVYEGLVRKEVKQADAGEIVAVSGLTSGQIGVTLSENKDESPYPTPEIGEPTLHVTIGANTSPMAGREGKYVTSRQIEERLDRELESNLSLRVMKLTNGQYQVSGRGELHLSVLMETMRREGYEMEVGQPRVIEKEVEGVTCEPYEKVEIVVPSEYEGAVHQELGRRYGTIQAVIGEGGSERRIVAEMATRATLGLRAELLTQARGTLSYASELMGYQPLGRALGGLRSGGVLVASHTGQALAYGLAAAQERGDTYVEPGTEVYVGMIVGRTNRDEDIRMNVTKGKQLTNMRSKSSDGVIQLAPVTKMSLEQCLDFIADDELLEITPDHLRLRKKNLGGVSGKRT